MKKILLLVTLILGLSAAPQAYAQSVNTEALLLRIDALILEMQLVKKQVEAISGSSASVPTGSVLGASTGPVFTKSLEYGETNDDILKIQKLLATDAEIYPYGVASGFFGPKTQEAIRNLQTRFDLDPVGVIGPATTKLLEDYMRMYPSGEFPSDALSKKPQVLGVTTTSTTVTPTTPTVPTTVTGGINPLRLVDIEMDKGEAEVSVYYTNGDRDNFIADGDDEDEVIRYVSHRLGVKEAFVRDAAAIDEYDSDDDDDNYDEDDAEDYIDEADEAIEDAEDEIFDAEDDGEDVDYALDTLDEADEALDDAEDALDDEDYDDAVKYAKEAKSLAKKAEDRIGKDEDDDDEGEKGDSDDIDSITAEVEEDESEITVEYDNGDEYVFTVEEDKRDEIIEEVADELDMDEDDVEDLIEFDYGRIDSIEVLIGDGEAEVEVEYRSGVVLRFTVNEDDEDDIIEEVADELDEDEEDIEDIIDFDYI